VLPKRDWRGRSVTENQLLPDMPHMPVIRKYGAGENCLPDRAQLNTEGKNSGKGSKDDDSDTYRTV
jgi:hypothetical protein